MFTLTDPNLLDTGSLLIEWPFSYCKNQKNVDKFLAPHYAKNTGLEQMIRILGRMQCDEMEFPSAQNYWEFSKKVTLTEGSTPVVLTQGAGSAGVTPKQLSHELDVSLFESVAFALHKVKGMDAVQCTEGAFKKLTNMMWISQHVALCILGVVRIENDIDSIKIVPSDDEVKRNLRRTWFGVAFDKYSRLSDETQLRSINQTGKVTFGTLLFFTKQWRLGLPVDSEDQPCGAVSDLLKSALLPSVKIILGVLHRTQHRRTFTRGDARKLGCVHEFDVLHSRAKSQPFIDRIFDLRLDGVRLGEIQLTLGLVDAAEHLARIKHGDTWHNRFGDEQVKYIAKRLKGVSGLRVIEKELRQEETSFETPVDVDLFIIDENIGRVYAIQSKHLEKSFRSGLLDWVSRFRNSREDDAKQLGKAVRQLENLSKLCAEDRKTRDYLTSVIGIPENLIDAIRPVVLHNIGSIDFWKTETGVAIYDLHTFCNVLHGGEASILKIGREFVDPLGSVTTLENRPLDLAEPDAVLSAYLSDSNSVWAPIQNFAVAELVTRAIHVEESHIFAVGVGV